MKKNVLSLIVGASLVLPTMAMAAPVNNSDLMPADMRNAAVESTVQAEIEGPDGELLATQPGAVDVEESNTADVDMDMANEADEMNDETDDMDNEARDDNAALMNNAQATTNAAAMTNATTAQAPVQNAQALNMQHSNADYQPLIAGEAATENKVADAASTLQEKKKDKRGELLATQPANVQFKENRRIAVSR
jgi:cell division protein FtsN